MLFRKITKVVAMSTAVGSIAAASWVVAQHSQGAEGAIVLQNDAVVKSPAVKSVLTPYASVQKNTVNAKLQLPELKGSQLAQTNEQLPTANDSKSYIITSKEIGAIVQHLKVLNITPSHNLSIIDSIAVGLTEEQLAVLQKQFKFTVSENHKVKLSGSGWKSRQRLWQPTAFVAQFFGADLAHYFYNFGDDITIGFLDTGLDQLAGLDYDLYGRDKAWGTYDAVNNSVHNFDQEANGHGTHVASIAGNSDYDRYGNLYGVAPNAPLVGIKAFDSEGKATYADVIRGIDWALQVKDTINLRVLNMSFSGSVRSHYWDDPLNKAVMKAWQAGIVVVASAGNKGPDPMTIGVPGNVPYIITVGAMTDNYTVNDASDDTLTTFSSAGPTPAGFVKPDLLAPGGHLPGLMSFYSEIVTKHPEYHDGGRYFEMSGTSQAAAVVSGVVALMLAQEPHLTPDDVKCRLLDSARAAKNTDGTLAYSVFQQGAGVVNARDALYSNATNCANQSLNIAKDLSGEAHYYGPANINEDGNFYVEGLGENYVWQRGEGAVTPDALLWKVNYDQNRPFWQNTATTDALLWKVSFETDALLWKVNLESDALLWKVNVGTDALLWKVNFEEGIEPTISVNNWVEQQ